MNTRTSEAKSWGMNAVMDAIVQSFASVFEIELRDGDRTVAPAAWTPAMAL